MTLVRRLLGRRHYGGARGLHDPRMPRRAGPGALAAGIALALAGCAGTSGAADAVRSCSGTAAGSASGAAVRGGTVTVLAAASLTKPFTALAKDLESANPGVQVRLSFGSSTTLAQQIAQGAHADIYAPAGTKALDLLPADARQAPRTIIARNVLEIATTPGNPQQVTGLGSLADPRLDVVLCAASVPCGAAADRALAKAGVDAHVVSREIDVTATLAKVTLGEADAAIVYRSDVVSAGRQVTGVAIPAASNVTLDYPVVVLGDSPAAAAFAELAAGPAGARALTAAGFLAP